MDIKDKERPSAELVERYRTTLERMLRHQKATVTIELMEPPMLLESSVDNIIVETKYIWIQDIKISTPELKDLSVSLTRTNIDDDIDDQEIWLDACMAQDELYFNLKKYPGIASFEGDPYWLLWKDVKY